MLRKLMSLVALLAAFGAPEAFAQSSQAFPQKSYYASDYGTWSIHSQAANTYIFSPPGVCQVNAPSTGSFVPFNTNAPIFLQDATAANSELLTPSAVTNNGSSCGVSIAPANTHYSFNITSGTGGLQEVLNQIPAGTVFPVQVVLDRNWYTAISGITGQTAASVVYNAVGSAAAVLVDQTTAPYQFYSWNGTHYTPSASNLTAPTVAAGTGAGTGPTIAIVAGSTGIHGRVTLTTGTTPTASAAIMVLTWPAVASGGFQYAPVCQFNSAGTRVYLTGTSTSTAGPPATSTLTASATALTASVSGYVFEYNCH